MNRIGDSPAGAPVDLRVDIGRADEGAAWERDLAGFSDATPYQTLAYGRARWRSGALLPLRFHRGTDLVAMALVREVRLPLVRGGVAYVGWGPAWQRPGAPRDGRALRGVLRRMRELLVEARGLHVRVVPQAFRDETDVQDAYAEAGFRWSARPARTLLVGLGVPSGDLRSGLRRRWRQTLAKAERQPLEITQGTGVDLYDEGLRLFEEMHARKQFAALTDMRAFRVMQEALPAELKMQVAVCREGGRPLAALAWSVLGRTGLPLLAATGARALETGAAYLLWWRMLEWLNERGFEACDLGGVNAERNPGGYTFKTGMAESRGREVDALGDFDAYRPGAGHLAFVAARGLRDARFGLVRALARRRAAAPDS